MSDPAESVQLDLNNPVFQRQWFALPKEAQWRVLGTLRKLAGMTWGQAYQDRGLRWEVVHTRPGLHGGRLYSFRISRGFRGLAYREAPWMRLLSLHPDHDTAYRP
jgi:hypothetical protein